MSAKKKGSWIVILKCEVTKEVICDNCTEEQARSNPFTHAIQERETGQSDYTVTSIEENN